MFAHTAIHKAAVAAVTGQQLFTASTTWTVPAGVTSICIVCVQAGGPAGGQGGLSSVTIASTVVCRAQNENRIGDGGGDGGGAGTATYDSVNGTWPGGAGGGAGGYGGNGGNGGRGVPLNNNPSPYYGTAGSGGAGGGGSGAYYQGQGGPGGGVGVLGQGANGAAAGGYEQTGGPGSGGTGSTYGGGAGGNAVAGGRGGALAYKNNVSVTPGQSVTITVGTTGAGAGPGAVRIIWGTGRAFPSTSTGDL